MSKTGKRALITGITGQDGSYLAELLLAKGYEVHGIIRRSSTFNTQRLDGIYQDPHEAGARLFLHYGDLTDANNLATIIRQMKPTEVYNLGAQSHVRVSFDMPIYTADAVAIGAIKLLEAVRDYRSPYGCAKVFAHWTTINYREAYGLHASCGILFNHESPRRGETFVTRKITRAVGRIKLGLQEKLYLGNIDAQRDWGYAGDYVEAMWMMLQQDEPNDYVIATGKMLSVREFCELAFGVLDLDAKDFIEIDSRYFRPTEVEQLLGDSSKARKKLGWTPSTTVEELTRMMVEQDLELARREKTLRDAGHELPATAGHDQ